MNKNASGKSKKIPALSVLLLLTAASSVAQEKYTLDACRELALKNNKEVAIAEQTEAKTLYESKSYFANFFPKFTASGAYLLSNSSFKKSIESAYLPTFTPDPATGQLTPNVMTMPDGSPVVGADGNPVFRQYAYFPGMDFNIRMNGAYFAGLQAEQPVFLGGKIISAYKMSKIGRDIAGLNRSLTRAEVIVKTDEAFWLHVKAMESKKVAEAFKKVIVELMQNVDAAVKVGMKTRNDLLKVQVQMNKADLQIQQAENAIRLSRMNLCQIMGMPLTSDILIDARFDNDDTTDPTTTLPASAYYTARPEFSILDKQIELKSQQVRLVRSDFLPNVGIGANYGYLHAIEFNGSPLIDKASFSALLTVSIPVFHWGEGLNKIRAAKAEKQIIELQRDDLSEKMELEMLRARDKLSESQLEVSLTARALEQAAENMRESGNHYNVGLETLADYLEAQTLWQQASLEALTAKINRRLNETYYLKAVGGL
ncbi:MAG: TolC family protein [Tannerella sp.]|nr:TolC family protein [Tannerella sp.]